MKRAAGLALLALVLSACAGQEDAPSRYAAAPAARAPVIVAQQPPEVPARTAALAVAEARAGTQVPGPITTPRPAARVERLLAVPYRSQLDGNPYELSDCGPASMAMVLAYFGRAVPTRQLRAIVNDLQGTWGDYEAGSSLEALAAIAVRHGLSTEGLSDGRGFRRWSLDDVRRQLDLGRPVVPELWYRGLPGREDRAYNGDHYVVLTGYGPDGFVYHDPMDRDAPGSARRITAAQLDKAWRNGDFPYAALAVAGPRS